MTAFPLRLGSAHRNNCSVLQREARGQNNQGGCCFCFDGKLTLANFDTIPLHLSMLQRPEGGGWRVGDGGGSDVSRKQWYTDKHNMLAGSFYPDWIVYTWALLFSFYFFSCSSTVCSILGNKINKAAMFWYPITHSSVKACWQLDAFALDSPPPLETWFWCSTAAYNILPLIFGPNTRSHHAYGKKLRVVQECSSPPVRRTNESLWKLGPCVRQDGV